MQRPGPHLHPPDEVRSQLQRLQQEETPSREDVAAFTQWLKAQGKLSEFQSGLLLRGRWERLKIEDYLLVDRIGQGRLAGVQHLTALDLRKTKVTAKGIDELKKALPKCKIEWDGVEPKRK